VTQIELDRSEHCAEWNGGAGARQRRGRLSPSEITGERLDKPLILLDVQVVWLEFGAK
jgi:hypothetical protein